MRTHRWSQDHQATGRSPWADPQRLEREYTPTSDPRPAPIGQIPSYTFNQTGVGCAAHGNPTCLCDVIVSQETKIARVPIMFASIATSENGAPHRGNIVGWASTLLACFELERRLVDRQDEQGVFTRLPFQYGNLGWFKLGPEVRADLIWYARKGTIKFDMVLWLMPTEFTVIEVAHCRKLFNKYVSDARINRRKAQRKATVTP